MCTLQLFALSGLFSSSTIVNMIFSALFLGLLSLSASIAAPATVDDATLKLLSPKARSVLLDARRPMFGDEPQLDEGATWKEMKKTYEKPVVVDGGNDVTAFAPAGPHWYVCPIDDVCTNTNCL